MNQRLTHVQDSKTKLLFSLILVSALLYKTSYYLFVYVSSINLIILSICIHLTGSPTIRETVSHVDSTTLLKGKSVANIEQIDLDNEEYEDEYGYTDHIQGISKGIFHNTYYFFYTFTYSYTI